MFSLFRLCTVVGVAALACSATLTSCSSDTSSPGRTSATTSPPPNATDAAICQLENKAVDAYKAKDYTAWRLYMSNIATVANSASYIPLKYYADEVRGGETDEKATTTSTSKPKPRAKSKAQPNVTGLSGLFGTIGGYLGLQHVCANLPSA